jgi:arylsulfatase A-like enzyme
VPDRYRQPYAALPEPRQTYAGMVAAMDEAVGQIMAAIDEKNMRSSTLVIFSSDNGGPAPGRVTSNGPLRAGKATLYEGGVRVCACVAWEGHIKPGSVVDQPLHMVDWYPTLLKLAGASLDQKLALDGRDAWPTIAEGKPSPHEEILLNAAPANGAIRVSQWKLVLNGGAPIDEGQLDFARPKGKAGRKAWSESVELFDLANDLSEKNNLAATRPEKVKQLRDRYEALANQAAPPRNAPKAPGFQSPEVWGEGP